MPAPAHSIHSTKKRVAHKPRAPRTTVLHLSPDLEPGEPARTAVDLAILAQRAGWRALIASRGGLLVTEAERAAVRHIRMPLDSNSVLAGWRNRLKLSALIEKERPALLHAHGIDAAAHVLAAARAHRLPLIVDLARPLPERARTRHILKRLGRLACHLRTPSHFMAAQLSEKFDWPVERLHMIPPGVDMQLYNAGFVSPERLQALGRLWRLPEHAAVIVAPMPFVAGGGHKVLLNALAKIRREDAFIVIVGDNRPAPGIRAEIEALVDSNGLGGKVIMPDYCLDWPAACWLATVIVVSDTVPRSAAAELLAAQALGRPVIASDCGANKEMVKSGETAWLVPAGNVRALAEALAEAIGLDTNQRLDLARRTRDFVGSTFPQAGWFDAMLALYQSALNPVARPRKAAAA